MFLFSCKDDKIEPSSEASLTSLTLTVGSTDYEVTFTGTQHTLKVGPYGTEIPATVGVKNIVLSSGATSVDQGTQLTVTNNAVTLTVTAADGTTKKTYTVTLVFTTAGITSFTFEVPDNENMALDTADHKRIVGKIDQEAKTITFDRQSAYVYLDKLKATFEVSEAGAAVQVGGVDQESGTTEQDFSAPVSYVVSAEGTETATYRVTLLKSTMATIEDDSFRAKLKAFFPAAFPGDQLDITHDDVVNSGTLLVGSVTPKLTSLKGIEFFTALTDLGCANNSLTSLDLSKNTALDTLNCGQNSLASLDVSANTALRTLDCGFNSLPSLDVSKNTALTYLSCTSNALTSLDIRANTALVDLRCGSTSLSSLDVRANTALTKLYCFATGLISLDVRKNTALQILECYDNVLTSLDVRANTALTTLDCGNNNLASLDVSQNTALTELDCSENALTSLDVSKNTALGDLICRDNRLTSLDVTGIRAITGFFSIGAGTAEDNPLETLRVNTALQDNAAIITMKGARAVALTITTVNNEGTVACNDYIPVSTGGNCNQAP